MKRKKTKFRSRFSKLEIKHLLISVVVMSFFIAILLYDRLPFSFFVSIFIAFIVMTPAFVLHELGHKIVAQEFGYFAEYKMWTQGLIFAVLLVLITSLAGNPLVFIAPGAVYFSTGGHRRVNKEKVGKIGLAGPLINLGLVVIFGLIGAFSNSLVLQALGSMGAAVNAFLAMFNLIPFPPFDGQKVFSWNKNIWMVAIGMAIASFIFIGGL